MKISHQELAAWTPAPGTPGDALYQIAGGIKNIACNIWNSFPSEYVPNNPVTSPIKYFWNSSCAMPPTSQPPVVPPPPPYTGGQCDVRYNLYIKYRRVDVGGSPPNQTCNESDDPFNVSVPPFGLRGTFWGPIEAVFLTGEKTTFCGNGFWQLGVRCHGESAFPRNPNIVDVVSTIVPFSSGTLITQLKEIVVQRVDGLPDNCGNPSGGFPPGAPPAPTVFNIDIDDGDSIINIPVTWNGDINIPLTFGIEGVTINFDFGGISFNWNGDINIGGNGKNPFPEAPPVVITPGDDPPGGGGTNPKPGDPDVIEKPPIIVDPENPLDESPPPGEEIVYIEITVNDIFDNARYAIINIDPSKSVYFAGYVAWTLGTSPGFTLAPEIPIRREKNLFRKPEEYDGFKVTAINGAQLTVKTYTVVKNPATKE